jgi:hypothetical protein
MTFRFTLFWKKWFLAVPFLSAMSLVFLFVGCETIQVQNRADRRMIDTSIAHEKPGDYYVGRRFYKIDYHMWGWVKKPGERWKQAQLVMLNEQKMLAPDRAEHRIGSDNDYEYFLYGFYSGDKVYEPASDHWYPEFVLVKAILVDKKPPLLYPDSRWKDPKIRFLSGPEY